MRKVAVLFVLLSLVGGCSGGHKVAKPARKDESGHVIAAGDDWSVTGASGPSASQPQGQRGLSDAQLKALYKSLKCGVTPTANPEQQKKLPPGFNPNGHLSQPKNDFPIQASITPTRGDPQTKTTISVVAVGKPQALIVVFASFFDKRDHGMKGAEFADLAGHATLKGPIPKDAPVGLATIAVSASTRDKKSAVTTVTFLVTGPGCR